MEMKLPITRVQLFALLGYSLFLALTGLLLWGGYSSFLLGYIVSGDQVVPDFFLRWFMLPLVMILVAVLSYHGKGSGQRHLLGVFPFILLEISGILLFSVFLLSSAGEVQIILIGSLVGIANGLLFIAFQRLLATFDLKSAGSIVIGSAVLSPLIYCLFMFMPLYVSLLLVYLVLVPLCALLFHQACREADFSAPCFSDIPSKRRLTKDGKMRSLVQPLIYIALSAFIIGLFQAFVLNGLDATMVDSIKMVGLFISGLALLVVWNRLYPRISLDRIYQVIFPLVATTYLLLPTLGNVSVYVFIGFACTVFSVASALMVITCLEVSHGSGVYPVFVYAAFAGCVYLSSALGSSVSYLFERIGSIDTTGLFAVALIAIYILCMITFMAKRRQQSPDAMAADLRESVSEQGEVPKSTHIRCARLQKRFGLTERESEIAELLACGRDVPSIAVKLFISENTVRTHTKSFYKKMGIHTKQDFLNLLERTRPEDVRYPD